MSQFDAVFVGLTILDIAGRPVSGIPEKGGVHFIDQIRLNPAGTASGAAMNAAKPPNWGFIPPLPRVWARMRKPISF